MTWERVRLRFSNLLHVTSSTATFTVLCTTSTQTHTTSHQKWFNRQQITSSQSITDHLHKTVLSYVVCTTCSHYYYKVLVMTSSSSSSSSSSPPAAAAAAARAHLCSQPVCPSAVSAVDCHVRVVRWFAVQCLQTATASHLRSDHADRQTDRQNACIQTHIQTNKQNSLLTEWLQINTHIRKHRHRHKHTKYTKTIFCNCGCAKSSYPSVNSQEANNISLSITTTQWERAWQTQSFHSYIS